MQEKLYIADVGATGGPEDHWKELLPHCHFYTFDPDPRAKEWAFPTTHFQVGLWSSQCTKPLHLMAYPQASSLYKVNHKVLSGFANDHCHKEVGTTEIPLDTLDHLLEEQPLNFLKVDAEGAELEILKGAEQALTTKVLGVQLEVAFCERHEGAPLFAEIDQKMRRYNFALFHISREHWLRSNRLLSLDSKPQVIWGNALYLLTKEALFARAKTSPLLFTKYLMILKAYGLYDYAQYLCEEAKTLLDPKQLHALQKELRPPCFSKKDVFKILTSLVFSFIKYSLRWTKPKRARGKEHCMRCLRKLLTALTLITRNDYAFYD